MSWREDHIHLFGAWPACACRMSSDNEEIFRRLASQAACRCSDGNADSAVSVSPDRIPVRAGYVQQQESTTRSVRSGRSSKSCARNSASASRPRNHVAAPARRHPSTHDPNPALSAGLDCFARLRAPDRRGRNGIFRPAQSCIVACGRREGGWKRSPGVCAGFFASTNLRPRRRANKLANRTANHSPSDLPRSIPHPHLIARAGNVVGRGLRGVVDRQSRAVPGA